MKQLADTRERIAAAEAILKARLRDPGLSCSMLAREIRLDLPTFSKAFRQATGMTCTDYISAERIRLAKNLLRSDSKLIKEIASRVGFSDANYFARKFKHIEGVSPSSYRRLRQRED